MQMTSIKCKMPVIIAISLVVTLSTEASPRTQVLYAVEFTSADDAKLGSSKGSCWDTKLEKCATQVVKDAKTAARKID